MIGKTKFPSFQPLFCEKSTEDDDDNKPTADLKAEKPKWPDIFDFQTKHSREWGRFYTLARKTHPRITTLYNDSVPGPTRFYTCQTRTQTRRIPGLTSKPKPGWVEPGLTKKSKPGKKTKRTQNEGWKFRLIAGEIVSNQVFDWFQHIAFDDRISLISKFWRWIATKDFKESATWSEWQCGKTFLIRNILLAQKIWSKALEFVHGLLERVIFEREEFLAMPRSVTTFQVFGFQFLLVHNSADFHSRFQTIGREN